MEKITYSNLDDVLVKRVPQTAELVNEYRQDQGGEVLPHVLFESFARFIVKELDNAKTNETLADSFSFIEELLNLENEKIYNVVAVSFLEYTFEPYKPYFEKVSRYFGPKTLTLVKKLAVARE